MKYKLLHNPRCRKSREGLKFLKAKKIEFETVLYLEDLLDKKQIEEIIDKSEINPIHFIRKKEKIAIIIKNIFLINIFYYNIFKASSGGLAIMTLFSEIKIGLCISFGFSNIV